MGDPSFLENWLSDEEFRLSRLLEKVSLVIETNLSEDEVRRAQGFYGKRAEGMLRRGFSHADVIKKYPALTLTILVGHAALAYEQGRYWEDFWDELGLDRDPNFENVLRAQLRTLFKRYQLAEFEDLGNDYVRLLTLHAGVPTYCLGDLVGIIGSHLVGGRDASGASLVEWLNEPGKQSRMNPLDVPVRNFILRGGDFSLDILDRIFEFVEYTISQPDSWDELTLDTSTTGLPTMMLDGLIDHLRDHPIGGVSSGNASSLRRRRKPTLVYDLQDDQVFVSIPYPTDEPEVAWRVSFDGDTREVYAERGWGVSGDQEHPPTLVPVGSPIRTIQLQHHPSSESHRLPVVDKRDPLILFAADGRWIQQRATLPKGQVIALFPRDAQLVDAVSDSPIESGVEPSSPVGWQGWTTAFVDLTEHHSIRLARTQTSETGVARSVRNSASPTFAFGESILGLKALNGLTVYSTRPEITLPAHHSAASVSWRVRVRREGETAWLVDDEWITEAETTSLDPFSDNTSSLLGLFEIVVTGPLGSDIRQKVFLAEDLAISFDRDFRYPVVGGLSPITATADSVGKLEVDRVRVSFDVATRDAEIRVSDESRSFRLVMTPPYVEMRLDPVGKPAQWRTSVQVLTPGDLEDYSVIAARIPGDVSVSFALLSRNGDLLQEVTPDVPSDNTFQVLSRTFVDAVRTASGDCRIAALVDDSDGTTTSVALANIRPAELCGGITVVDGMLIFEDLAAEDDLAIYLWSTTAPWLPMRTLEISEGRVALPEDLVDAGPLLGQVFVDDPWVTITPPRWPDSSAIRIEQRGWVRDANGTRDKLARFLAGEGSPPTSGLAMPETWAALAMLREDAEDVATQRLRAALVRILSIHPRSALEALGSSTIPAEEMVALLIRTGLVNRSFSAEYTLNDLHTNPWVGSMVEVADLPSLFERRVVVGEERAETISYLSEQCGPVLFEVLRGSLEALNSGYFDLNVARVHSLSKPTVDKMFEQFRLVPGALLDLDTRVDATIDAFHRRGEWMSSGAHQMLASESLKSLRLVRQSSKAIYNVISSRSEALDGVDTVTHPWMLLSMQSLTLAALARLDAHGMLAYSPLTTGLMEAWARMAWLCPKLVMTDLLIAEALVTYAHYGDLIGVENE
ncbi:MULTISPECIES: hypothetical protein [Rhodococcus]|uniref:hypothetical protein n=1 Tax=Rhodococcus TaxID=1827 RepID=UPI000A9D835A|nr:MULTISPECIES: hypothetical protein [Rhodococcus]MCJ0950019.1 hypothetical protein [Rhodococcus sp. ARC_M8]UKO84710.1 hypothetical protein ITJ47_21665 [Rhodococcus erythropolis]ULD41803.1 hypothetical protein JKI97_01845 [Rhodococcus qingshengii]BBE46945.1 hypothetical protein RE2895_38760 [Rhodococcus erythropolis]